MPTLEETMKLIAEEHRKTAEEHRKTAEEHRKLVEANRRFSAELLEFKEQNRIGFEELREIQKKNEMAFEKYCENQQKSFEKLSKRQQNNDDQWGRLVEALVNNQLVPLLRSRGIPIERTSQRTKGCVNGHNYEFDIVAKNGDSVVVVEVKTTLRVDEVKRFLNKLHHFKEWEPDYSHLKVYGAVAFLHEASDASIYAAESGLLTILATGSGARITNPPDFQPKMF